MWKRVAGPARERARVTDRQLGLIDRLARLEVGRAISDLATPVVPPRPYRVPAFEAPEGGA